MRLRFGSPDFRRLRRGLVIGSLFGSLVYGWQHVPVWLFIPPLAFTLYLLLEDRAVRIEVGNGAWPSRGYARFLFGTNVFSMVWNSLLSTAAFGLAAIASAVLV